MKKIVLILVLASLSFAFASCNRNSENKEAQSSDSATQLLVVERQSVILSEDSPSVSVTVDVPIAGSQVLMDSVMEFLNREVYDFLDRDGEDARCFPYEEVRARDADHFSVSYERHYGPLITKEAGWNVDKIAVVLISQTESFVTYGIEVFSCGATCCTSFNCYTFNKIDGHIIKDIINQKDLAKFVNKVVLGNCGKASNESCLDMFEWGLCESGLAYLNHETNHYEVGVIDYKEALPYLSDEAKSLVEAKGETNACNWEDWFVGTIIGEVVNNEGRTIMLAERHYDVSPFSDWCLEESYIQMLMDEVGGDWSYSDLNAFSVQEGVVVPEEVIEYHDKIVSGIVPNYDEVFTSTPNGNHYSFNPHDNSLYIPMPENVLMGHHPCADRYDVYQFDGNHFKSVRVDGGFWLHPSVRQFERMLLLGKAGPYFFRVDEMRIYDTRYDDQYEEEKRDTCRFRYAAWMNGHTMLDKPDLVIENGTLRDGVYVFENKGYTYIVKGDVLCVYQGKKQISSMALETYVVYEN